MAPVIPKGCVFRAADVSLVLSHRGSVLVDGACANVVRSGFWNFFILTWVLAIIACKSA